MSVWKKIVICIFTLMLIILIIIPVLINTNAINRIIKQKTEDYIKEIINGECDIKNLKASLTTLTIDTVYLSNSDIIAQIDNMKLGISLYSIFIGKVYLNFVNINNAYIRVKEYTNKSISADTVSSVFHYNMNLQNITLPVEIKSLNFKNFYIQYDTFQIMNIECVSSISINKKRIAVFYKIFSAKLNHILSINNSNGEIILSNNNGHFSGNINTDRGNIDYEFIVYDSTVNINTFNIEFDISNMNIANNSIDCYGKYSIRGFIKSNNRMLNIKGSLKKLKMNDMFIDSIDNYAYLKNDSLIIDKLNIFNGNGIISIKGFSDILEFPNTELSIMYKNIDAIDFFDKELLNKFKNISGHLNFSLTGLDKFTVIVDSLYAYVGIDTINNTSGIISFIDNQLFFRDMNIGINGGILNINGKLSRDDNNCNIIIENIPISPINYFYSLSGVYGQISGTLSLKGGVKDYKTLWDISINNFLYEDISIGYVHLGANLNKERDTIPDGILTLKLINTNYASKKIDILYAEISKLYKNIYTNLSLVSDIGYIEYEGEYSYDLNKRKLSGLIQKFNLIDKGMKIFLTKPVYLTLTEDTIEFSEVEIRGKEFLMLAKALKAKNNIDANIMIQDDSLQIVKFFIPGKFNGNFNFSMNINGTVISPKVDISARVYDFVYDRMNIDSLILECSYIDNLLDLTDFSMYYKDTKNSVNGNLNIIDLNNFKKSEISLLVDINRVDGDLLSPLYMIFTVDSGYGEAELSVKGNIMNPDIQGDVNIHNGSVNITALGSNVYNINGRAYFSKDTLKIDKIKGKTERGNVLVNGYVLFGNMFLNYYYFNILAKGVHVKGIDYIDAYGDCDIDVYGSITKPIIEGDIIVKEGVSDIPFFNISSNTSAVSVDSSCINLNIIAKNGNVWIRNSFVDVEIMGNINLLKIVSRWKITGKANIKRGFYFYIDRRFTIEEGFFELRESEKMVDIFMNIKSNINMRYLDVSGEREALIYLNVYGQLEKPNISFYSQPPLSMENILSILSFNTTVQSLNQIQNISKMLPEKALQFYLRNTYLKTISSSLKLDELNLETNILSGQKSAKLSVGKYINKNIFISYTHDIFSFANDVFKIEYKLNNNSNIITERDEDGEISAGFQFKLRY